MTTSGGGDLTDMTTTAFPGARTRKGNKSLVYDGKRAGHRSVESTPAACDDCREL